MKNSGAYIREVRLKKGLSQEFMAEELNISYQAYQAYEAGRTRLINPKLPEICHILDIDLLDLFRDTTDFSYKAQQVSEYKVKEVIPEYINDNLNDLRKRNEELIAENAILKYKLSEIEGSGKSEKSKKAS